MMMKAMSPGRLQPHLLGVAIACMTVGQAQAFEVDLGDSDFRLRWDNTVRYNWAMRLQDQSHLIDRAGGGAYDQSNAAFDKYDTISNRLDLLSEIDLNYQGRYGARLSAAAWYDEAYDGKNPATVPGGTSYVDNRFTHIVKRYYAGPSGEFLDAYVYGRFEPAGLPTDLRLGQHAVIWGEGLFGSTNAISYSQAPADLRKATANPGASAKETALPIDQISFMTQASDQIVVAGQYLFEWDPNRIPEGGTYFAGSDAILEGPNVGRGKAIEGDKGDYGLSVRYRPDWFDGTLGLYYRRFDEKSAWVSQRDFATGLVHAVYAKDIELYGLSVSSNIGGVSIGAELSYRENMPLNSSGAAADQARRLEGARGSTWHALVNAVQTYGDTALFDSASLSGELAWAKLDKVTDNRSAYRAKGYNAGCNSNAKMLGCSDDEFYSVAVAFTPTWVQVFPSIDLKLPIFLSRNLSGNAPTNGGGSEGFTTAKVGISAEAYSRHFVDLAVTYYDQKKSDSDNLILGAPYLDKAWVSLTYQTTF
ncbi:DUF1302 domain-containing protein [Pseudomonas sp. NPDC089392]|uniref:DUF1302 domain-containing protein n=1 Tax=Pseudomonas sp. NPDC089392 TaxID=3364459 RepID=UPI00382C0E82